MEWVDGLTSWLPLKEIKETNAVDTAQYAIHNRINEEPAFEWWAKEVIKRRKRLIKMSQSRHTKQSGYKFGIRIPRNTAEALAIDRDNNCKDWYNAIMKQMENVRIAFKIQDHGTHAPPGFEKIPLTMI